MTASDKLTVKQVFATFLRLGLTSFGGPVAHLGYFHDEFVKRRGCLQEERYAGLVALCQFLPGPASSQVGIAIGISQAGLRGGLAAWIGFTLPSALAMLLFALLVTELRTADLDLAWLHGLKVVAVAVVAQAIWGMARSLCPDRSRASLAIVATILALTWPGVAGQLAAIGGGALVGLFCFRDKIANTDPPPQFTGNRKAASLSLVLFLLLLLILPLLAVGNSQLWSLIDSFYRSGALVFGGGHVVLPLLQAEVVETGWISQDVFLAGYGAAQAVPGPLFSFSAFLGGALPVAPNGWGGGGLCLLAIYLPSFLLIVGVLPFWDQLGKIQNIRSALVGVNAAVVGLLLAAFYDPVWCRGILSAEDFLLALLTFGLLVFWKCPAWLVVALAAAGGALLTMLH